MTKGQKLTNRMNSKSTGPARSNSYHLLTVRWRLYLELIRMTYRQCMIRPGTLRENVGTTEMKRKDDDDDKNARKKRKNTQELEKPEKNWTLHSSYIYIPVCGQSITCVCALSMHGALFPIINTQLRSLQIFAKRMLTIYQTDTPYSQPLYLRMIEREDAYPDLINAVAALRVC